MASLIETAHYTRKVIQYGAIGLVVLIVGRMIVGGAASYWRKLHPPPPPPPTVGFSKLPPLVFPDTDRPQLTFTLETVSGGVPMISDRGTVYFMPVARPNLLALERATQTAASLGFIFPPEPLSERTYRFSRTSPLPSRFDIDIITGSFDLRVDWFANLAFLQQRFLPDQEQAITEVKNYLRAASLLPDDLANGEARVTPLKAFGQGYQQAVSISEANFIQVDLFRTPLGDGILPVITPISGEGIVRVILSGSRSQGERFVFVKYDYFPVDTTNSHTYPLRSSESAWQELQQGGGHIVSFPRDKTTVTVRTVGLGYYDAFEPQNYLQPVYIFSGDDGFLAVVPAVDPVWISEE